MTAYNCIIGVQELIDTQWDVNAVEQGQTLDGQTELIDTQWDVNQPRTQ